MGMVVNIYGEEYDNFWNAFNLRHPNVSDCWYEVYLDFWEDVYNESLSLEENIANAADYIREHENDYD